MSENPIPLWNVTPPFYKEEYQTKENETTSTITPYLVKDSFTHSALLICPGGGFTHRAEHEGSIVANYFQKLGIHSFVLNYRVIPYHPMISLVDAFRAIRYLRYYSQKFHLFPDKIAIMGFSAGGSISAFTSELYETELYPASDEIDQLSARPDAAILCYAGLSFRKQHLTESDYHTLEANFSKLKNFNGSIKDFTEQYSCDCKIHSNMPPVFLWHTMDDKRVPVAGVLNYIEKLNLEHISSEIHLFPKGEHGLGVDRAKHIEGVCQWPDLCMNWLKRQGF